MDLSLSCLQVRGVRFEHLRRQFEKLPFGVGGRGFHAISAKDRSPGGETAHAERTQVCVHLSDLDLIHGDSQLFGHDLSQDRLLSLTHVRFPVVNQGLSLSADAHDPCPTIEFPGKSTVSRDMVTTGKADSVRASLLPSLLPPARGFNRFAHTLFQARRPNFPSVYGQLARFETILDAQL